MTATSNSGLGHGSSGNPQYVAGTDGDRWAIYRTASSAWVFSVNGSGAYWLSDRYHKKNISIIPESSLETLFDISDKLIKAFTWKETGKASYGFIAQQLEKYIPEAINEDSNGIKSVSYDVAYAKVIASLIHEVKELKKIVSRQQIHN